MSTSFNKYERAIARLLSSNPRLKKNAKFLYSRIVYAFNRKNKNIYTTYDIKEVSDDQNETFFGYYDKSPLNETGNYLIYHSSKRLTAKLPDPNEPIQVILANFTTNEVIAKFDSKSYNWQQGAKLQWLDNNKFIFNDFDFEREIYISRIVNADNGKIEKIVDFPIYDTCKSFGISLSFDRLAILRPDYGYRNLAHKNSFELSDLKDDGIFYIDLDNNKQKLILSLEDIIAIERDDKMDNALHKVNHIMISPNGEYFIFLHRYFVKGVKYDRLLLSNTDGSQVKVLSDHQMISHCFWKNDDTIISFMRRFDYGDKYFEIDISSGKVIPIGLDIIDKFGDGHPNYYGNQMLFDTYPNKARMKEMYMYDFEKCVNTKVGAFFESFKYGGETRCDLHQRWSMDGNYIFFDSLHTGLRKLYYLKANK